jgi:DNA polymerase V
MIKVDFKSFSLYKLLYGCNHRESKCSMQIQEIFSFRAGQRISLPLASASVRAGFPSPAEDHIEKWIDLNDELIQHPAATFFVRVHGESMHDVGIHSGDILIVDKALEVKNHKIVVAVLNGEFTVKRIEIKQGSIYLLPENSRFSAIEVSKEAEFQVWGVVTNVIHAL